MCLEMLSASWSLGGGVLRMEGARVLELDGVAGDDVLQLLLSSMSSTCHTSPNSCMGRWRSTPGREKFEKKYCTLIVAACTLAGALTGAMLQPCSTSSGCAWVGCHISCQFSLLAPNNSQQRLWSIKSRIDPLFHVFVNMRPINERSPAASQ
jgi:hypothetical protein